MLSPLSLCLAFFPKKTCQELDNLISKFWWGQKKAGKDSLASWSKLTISKFDGGMGFRNFMAFNMALVAK